VNTKKWSEELNLQGKIKISKVVESSSCVDSKGNLYIFGGVNKDLSFSWRLLKFSRNQKKWEIVSDLMLEGRINHSINISGHFLFVYGGKTHNFVFSDFNVFDLKSRIWSKILSKNGPSKRYGHSTFIFNKKLYLFGGRNEIEIFSDFWSFDPTLMKWEKVNLVNPGTLKAQYFSKAILLGNFVFIFFGMNSLTVNFSLNFYFLDLFFFCYGYRFVQFFCSCS